MFDHVPKVGFSHFNPLAVPDVAGKAMPIAPLICPANSLDRAVFLIQLLLLKGR
jgi:hypothetical protein